MRATPRGIAAVALALLVFAASAVGAQDTHRLEVVARVQLREIQKGASVARAYMGAGITLRVKRPADGMVFGETLAVSAGTFDYAAGDGGLFVSAALYRFGGMFCLVVGEYTGGAHCCGQYHVFVRAADAAAWTFAGVTGAENGGPMPASTVVLARDGALYLREWDNRFDYFHACHACSLLGNVGPQYSRIEPGRLVPADDAFRDEYAKLAEAAQPEIAAEAGRRTTKPSGILGPVDGSGEASFSDDLGQLLVKRTIFLLRAGEEERAWREFDVDVARWYATRDGADRLRKEIAELLGR